jgi:hypothetical protein
MIDSLKCFQLLPFTYSVYGFATMGRFQRSIETVEDSWGAPGVALSSAGWPCVGSSQLELAGS